MTKFHDLLIYCKINKNINIDKWEIILFFESNKYLLNLNNNDLEYDLYKKWSYNKFIKLLECIYSINKENFFVNVNNQLDEKKINELYEIEKIIFEKNSFEEIYNKFIIPNSIIENDIDYWFTEVEIKYVANLTYSLKEIDSITENFELVFKENSDTTLENKRQIRKQGLEILLTYILKNKNIKTDKQLVNLFFNMMDNKLKQERDANTDKIYWSFHNVIYGFITHKDIYKNCFISTVNLSSFSYICFIKSLMYILQNNLITNS